MELYHAMCQAGGGNWTHAVSNDLVTWFRMEDALGRGAADSPWDRYGPCDGTASFPGGSLGVGPVILYGADCASKNVSASEDGSLPPLGDFPRVGVARPADPTSPYLKVCSPFCRDVCMMCVMCCGFGLCGACAGLGEGSNQRDVCRLALLLPG